MNTSAMTVRHFVSSGISTFGELHDALRLAMQLEFATIPPYLCAQWSIVRDPDRVEGTLHAVVSQEMQHFAIAGNLLSAIGGRPHVATAGFIPKYPIGRLPGEVGLSRPLGLSELSPQQVEMFMEIEHPAFPPIALNIAQPSIGAFYDIIITAFRTISPPIDPAANSIELPLATPIATVADAILALERIKEEGEGTSVSPQQPLGEAETVAHYYQFKQILRGQRLVKNGNKWDFTGDPIQFPAVCSFRPAIQHAPELIRFREILSGLLRHLEDCWTLGSPFNAVEMFRLGIEGRRLVRNGIAPDFTWLDDPSA